jgi:hypothetical protein
MAQQVGSTTAKAQHSWLRMSVGLEVFWLHDFLKN